MQNFLAIFGKNCETGKLKLIGEIIYLRWYLHSEHHSRSTHTSIYPIVLRDRVHFRFKCVILIFPRVVQMSLATTNEKKPLHHMGQDRQVQYVQTDTCPKRYKKRRKIKELTSIKIMNGRFIILGIIICSI